MTCKNMEVQIEVLKASYGDCIFVTIQDKGTVYTIMIDGGTPSTYSFKNKKQKTEAGPLKLKLSELQEHGRSIDLLIITHVDNDHIGGIIKWFKEDMPSPTFVKRIWLNDDVEVNASHSLNNTPGQAASLKDTLINNGFNIEDQIVKDKVYPFNWGSITILAPTPEDHNKVARKIGANLDNKENNNYKKNIRQLVEEGWEVEAVSDENEASIAFLLQTNDGENDLFLGDGNIDTIIESLHDIKRTDNGIHCKWVKLSHHGSKNNFKPEYLDYVHADNYIFSSNGDYYGHPDKEVMAWLVDKTDSILWFNYLERGKEMVTAQDKEDYPDILIRMKEI